eukprot:UC1_evm1s1234
MPLLVCLFFFLAACGGGGESDGGGGAYAELIAQSEVKRCIADGSTTADEPTMQQANGEPCEKKLVLTLTVSNSQRDSEWLHLTSARDDSGANVPLAAPWRVTLRKARARVIYPVYYKSSVNNKPREKAFVVETFANGIFGEDHTCNDHPGSEDVSCGWVLGAQSERVENSQGFCCACDLQDQFGTSGGPTRGELLSCALFGAGQASAHCLRMDELWYNVFELGPPETHFEVVAAVAELIYPDSSASASLASPPQWVERFALTVGPTQRQASTVDGRMRVKYLGDFALTRQLEDLTSMLLLEPEPSSVADGSGYTHEQVVAGLPEWLLVDKTAVDLNGGTCNKIGVSYSAFRHHGQAGGCFESAGNCLKYQPRDLWERDRDTVARGEMPEYFVSRLGGNVALLVDPENQHYVSYTQHQIQDSVVLIEMEASDVAMWTAVSQGRIVSVNTNIFEAATRNGWLSVMTTNTGVRPAMYSLAVHCSSSSSSRNGGGAPALKPILAQENEVRPATVWHANFSLVTTTIEAADYICEVLLYNALGALLDNRTITVMTTSTCLCLGSCDCSCDDSSSRNDKSLLPERCLTNDDPETRDDRIKSGGGFQAGDITDTIFGWMDDIGLDSDWAKGLVGSAIGLVIIFALVCLCLKCVPRLRAGIQRRRHVHKSFHAATTGNIATTDIDSGAATTTAATTTTTAAAAAAATTAAITNVACVRETRGQCTTASTVADILHDHEAYVYPPASDIDHRFQHAQNVALQMVDDAAQVQPQPQSLSSPPSYAASVTSHPVPTTIEVMPSSQVRCNRRISHA